MSVAEPRRLAKAAGSTALEFHTASVLQELGTFQMQSLNLPLPRLVPHPAQREEGYSFMKVCYAS
jgi:hypothetical protein